MLGERSRLLQMRKICEYDHTEDQLIACAEETGVCSYFISLSDPWKKGKVTRETQLHYTRTEITLYHAGPEK